MPEKNLKLASGGTADDTGRARFVLTILMAQAIGQRQNECPIENCGGAKNPEQVVCPACFRAFGGWKIVNWIKNVRASLYAQQILGELYHLADDDAYELLKRIRAEHAEDDVDIPGLIIAAQENTRHPENPEKLAFKIDGRTSEDVRQALTIVWNRALRNLKAREEKCQANNLLFEKMMAQVEDHVPVGQFLEAKQLAVKLYHQYKPAVAEDQAIRMYTAAYFRVIENRKPLVKEMKQAEMLQKAAFYAATVADFTRNRGPKHRQGVPGAGPNANNGLGQKKRPRGRQRDRQR